MDKEGEEHNFEVAQGDNLLDVAQSEELEMEGKTGTVYGRRKRLIPHIRGLRRVLRLFYLPCHCRIGRDV